VLDLPVISGVLSTHILAREFMPRRTPRQVLAQRRSRSSGIAAWLRSHPAAAAFVRTWLEMRRNGETDWGVRRVVAYLRQEHRFPFSSEPAFWAYCHREFPDLMDEAKAR